MAQLGASTAKTCTDVEVHHFSQGQHLRNGDPLPRDFSPTKMSRASRYP
jgi:hypothetical protein